MPSKLPKVYLRIDPNLALTHPDPGSFVRLLCFANAQPVRGRFKDWTLVAGLLGKDIAEALRARGDLVQHKDGRWYVDAWDDWQEGDLEVSERVRRFREKKRVFTTTKGSAAEQLNKDEQDRPVTQPLPDRYPASETLDEKALDVETGTATDSAAKPRRTWLTPYIEAWRNAYGGEPHAGKLAKFLRPLETKHGPGELLSRWMRYCAETAADFASVARFSETFGRWATGQPGTAIAPARASPPTLKEQKRRDVLGASIMGGVKGDGTLGSKGGS